MRNALRDLQKSFGKISDGVIKKVTGITYVLGNVTDALEKVETANTQAKDAIEGVRIPLNTAISCSVTNACLFEDGINAIAGVIPIEAFEAILPALEFCSIGFDTVSNLDIGVDTEAINDVIGIFDPIKDAVSGISSFFETIFEGAMSSVNQEMCCNDVLRALGDFLEAIGKLIDLATCFIPVETLVGAAKDNSVADNLKDDLLEVFKPMDIFAVALGEIEFKEIRLLPSFSLRLDEETCALQVDGSLSVDFVTNSTSIEHEPIEINFEDVGGLVNNGVNEIKDACSSNFEAFIDAEDGDEIDCCDLARTCDPADRIIFYDEGNCGGYISGTLSLPAPGSSATKKSDAACIPNDEAKSVEFVGPMPRGVIIEVADDFNDWCADDYAIVRLEKELLEGERLCIPEFTIGCYEKPLKGPNYTRLQYYNGNIAGKISQFRVTAPSSTYNPNAALGPLRAVCRNEPLTFYEDNGCIGDSVGTLGLPPTGSNIDGCELVQNDEARSLKLKGPIPAGFSIRVTDNCGDFCGDDYAAIIIRKALLADEEICICSFEQTASYEYYDISYSGGNGLDGKISYTDIINSGNPDYNTWPNCP